MRYLANLLLLLSGAVHATALTANEPLVITSLTSGNELGVFTAVEAAPGEAQLIYADNAIIRFDPDSVAADFIGATLIKTKEADEDSNSTDVIQFTTSREALVCVWHSEDETNPAWIASDGYADWAVRLDSVDAETGYLAYCDIKAAGSYGFDGNTVSGTATGPMYFVTVQSSTFQAPDQTGAPTDNGDYDYSSATYTVPESTTQAVGTTLRSGGSDGAVSVDITDAATGSCTSGVDYTAITDTTINWADGEDGVGGDISLVASAVSGDCTVDLAFTAATGGISAGTITAATVTIEDTPAAATDYWVAKDGSDSNSCVQAQTEGTAKLTIAAGIGCLLAGDVLTVKAGTYLEGDLGGSVPSGTSWANATTIVANGSDTIIVKPSSGDDRCWTFVAKSYVILDGIDCNADDVIHDGIKITNTGSPISHHIRITNLAVYNATKQGILDSSNSGAGFNEFVDNDIHDNGTDPQFHHGLYISSFNTLIDGNLLYDNIGAGMQLYKNPNDGPNPADGVVINNIVWGNGQTNGKAGLTIAGDRALVANNIVHHGGGNGIVCFKNDDILLLNNTIYDNAKDGIEINDNAIRCNVKNNIVYANDISEIDDNSGGDAVLSNNVTTNPSFTDPDNANRALADFTFGSGSSACEAGTDLTSDGVTDDIVGTARPQDTNYEAGAYEIAACP